jgi:glycosyltransferase involved in cell wall biosynthesis
LSPGGPNPNHLDKAYYQKYLSEINNIASKHPQNIQITGFVDEKDIEKYYQLSDLILLPYRVGMSSSGPLSIAFTHHKPFFVSDKIAPILNTSDIKTIFEKHSLSSQIVSFPLESKKLLEKIIHLKKDSKLQKELGLISQEISLTRSWNNVSKQYLTCLNL